MAINALYLTNSPGLPKMALAAIILAASLLATSYNSLAQNIHIDGNVKGSHYNNNLNGAKVVAIKVSNGTRVDSTYTDSNGNYNMNFLWTKINEKENLESKLYPNPYTNQTTINVNNVSNKTYQLSIFDLNGQKQLHNHPQNQKS
jgi:hypothetical protein